MIPRERGAVKTRKRLICFGDSLTQGTIGASYVDLLRRKLPSADVINAGVNGDTIVNLLRRIECDVVRRRPDGVLVLIGLNDLGSAYGEPAMRRYYRTLKRVRIEVTPLRFARGYRHLVQVLRERTNAQLFLCTPPTLGEDPDDIAQPIVDAYAHVVRALTYQHGLPLIDLRAHFMAAMRAAPRDGPPYHIWTPVGDWAAIGLRRRNYESLREKRGYRLVCDGVHLSLAGATMAADVMVPVLERDFG